MRPPIGVSSSSTIMTARGPAKADLVQRGDELLCLVGGELRHLAVKRVDRGLCCTMVRIMARGGYGLVAGSGTSVMMEAEPNATATVLDGGILTYASIVGIDRLNFCQHAIHFYCGEGTHVFAGAEACPLFAVNASFMERD